MDSLRVVDVVDETAFRLVPPCANPGFDHRSCDFWEDADREPGADLAAAAAIVHDGLLADLALPAA